MEDDTAKHEFPDFGPDDDTEEMNGVPVYNPDAEVKSLLPKWDFLPRLPELPKKSKFENVKKIENE